MTSTVGRLVLVLSLRKDKEGGGLGGQWFVLGGESTFEYMRTRERQSMT